MKKKKKKNINSNIQIWNLKYITIIISLIYNIKTYENCVPNP